MRCCKGHGRLYVLWLRERNFIVAERHAYLIGEWADESKAGTAISPPFDKRGRAGNPTVTQWERFPTQWQNTGQLAPVMRGHSEFHWWTAGGTRPCLGPVRDMTLHLLQYLWSRLRHDTSLAVVLWSSHRHDISWSSHRHDTSLAAVPLVQSETRHFTCCSTLVQSQTRHFTCCSTSGPVTDTTLTCCNTSGPVTNTTFHLL